MSVMSDRLRTQERQAWLDSLKSKPCMDCGNTFPPECMDFDHRPGEEKLFNIRAGYMNSALLNDEIAKCDLICANCHRIRTRSRIVKKEVVLPKRKPRDHKLFGCGHAKLDNTYTRKDGRQQCRQCALLRVKKAQAARR